MNRFLRGSMMVASLVACGFIVQAGSAQEKKEKSGYKGRLPAGWKNIGLSDDQEKQIKDIQIKNHDKITRLEDELEKIKADQMKAMRRILNPDQVRMIDKMESEKKKKAGKAAKSAKDTKDDDDPPAKTKKAKDASKKKSSEKDG